MLCLILLVLALFAEGGDEQGTLEEIILSLKQQALTLSVIKKTIDAHDRLFDHGFQGEAYWVHGAGQVYAP